MIRGSPGDGAGAWGMQNPEGMARSTPRSHILRMAMAQAYGIHHCLPYNIYVRVLRYLQSFVLVWMVLRVVRDM